MMSLNNGLVHRSSELKYFVLGVLIGACFISRKLGEGLVSDGWWRGFVSDQW